MAIYRFVNNLNEQRFYLLLKKNYYTTKYCFLKKTLFSYPIHINLNANFIKIHKPRFHIKPAIQPTQLNP